MGDAIVEEVWAARTAHAARFNYDVEAIYRDLKAQEQQGPTASGFLASQTVYA